MRKHLLVPSKIEYCDYEISCYDGCKHGCTYCYARLMKRKPYFNWILPTLSWLYDFSDVFIKDITSLKGRPNNILISSMCDPYQPLEEEHKTMRGIIPILKEHNLPFSILTKSDLVLRDIDLLRGYDNCKVGFTIITLNDSVRRLLEPMAPSIERRIKALKKLHDEGIKTWVSVEPILPLWIWGDSHAVDPFEIIGKLHEFVDWFVFGRLNYMKNGKIHSKYYNNIAKSISRVCDKLGIKYLIKKEMKA